MVAKKSEYRQEYKPCLLKTNFPIYLENVQYRNHRRDLEFAHTPISWEAEDSTPEITSCEDIIADKIPLSKQKVEEEEEEEKEEKKDDRKEMNKEKEDIKDAQKKEEDSVVIIRQNRDLAKAAKVKLNKYVSKENKDESQPEKPSAKEKEQSRSKSSLLQPEKVDDKTFAYKFRPKRPDRLRKLFKARPLSAATEKAKRKSPDKRPASASQDLPPFAMYGISETGRDVGMQRTFNVRASKEVVYPAALLALKRPLMEIKRREEMQRKASAREKKMKAPIDDKMSRETSNWESEYQNRFPAYEKSEYAKVLSARVPKDRPISVPYFF